MSTESLRSIQKISLTPAVLEMDRCPSPCSSIRAVHPLSRPNSYNAFEGPFSLAALADLVNIQTPGEITSVANNVRAACVVEKQEDAQSVMTRGSGRSNGTSRSTRSRIVRRSDASMNFPVLASVVEDYAGETQKEKEMKQKKTWANSSKRWKRTMSQLFTGAKENAGILDRSVAAAKASHPLTRTATAPLKASAPLSTPLTTPAATWSKRGRSRTTSLFQFGRPRTPSIASKKTVTHCAALTSHANVSALNVIDLKIDTDLATKRARNQRVRHSRSFSGFTDGDLVLSPEEVASPVVFASFEESGQFNVYGFPQAADSLTLHDGVANDEEDLDGLDDATREAAAISRSVSTEWGYVEEE